MVASGQGLIRRSRCSSRMPIGAAPQTMASMEKSETALHLKAKAPIQQKNNRAFYPVPVGASPHQRKGPVGAAPKTYAAQACSSSAVPSALSKVLDTDVSFTSTPLSPTGKRECSEDVRASPRSTSVGSGSTADSQEDIDDLPEGSCIGLAEHMLPPSPPTSSHREAEHTVMVLSTPDMGTPEVFIDPEEEDDVAHYPSSITPQQPSELSPGSSISPKLPTEPLPPPPGIFYANTPSATQLPSTDLAQTIVDILLAEAGSQNFDAILPPPGSFLTDATAMAHPSFSQQAFTSIGSAMHHKGTCKPCVFFHRSTGCTNGSLCSHCHLCPPEEKHRRRLLKRGLPWKLPCHIAKSKESARPVEGLMLI